MAVVRSFSTAMSSGAASCSRSNGSRPTGDSLLRISQACETLLAGFYSGQATGLRSCLVSRDRAASFAERNSNSSSGRQAGQGIQRDLNLSGDYLPPLEEAMVRRRTRPSFLLPAWRAVGFAVGTGSSALLPPNAVDKVGASISTIVAEQYDANIRSMYEAKIEQEEREVKDLFKAQRDDPARICLGGENPEEGTIPDARIMVIEGSLKSVLRVACDVTSKM